MAEGLFECIALESDPEIRRSRDGTVLLGGSPLRLLRFSPPGARLVADLLTGRPVGPDVRSQAVARKLLDAGMAHPRPVRSPALTWAVVIPVRDDERSLAELCDALGHGRTGSPVDPEVGAAPPKRGEVVVVDDGSTDPDAVPAAVGPTATVVRHDTSRGPGAARNTGWRSLQTEVIVFVDADVEPSPGWLEPLLRQMADPQVGIVAPRVRSRTGPGLLARYDAAASPLDLGGRPANVVPGGRVSYVPSAALVVRREVLEDLHGFDESLATGEDVDLVWRAIDAGWRVRYEPTSVVWHRPRPDARRWMRQRFGYGRSAAALDRRHPGAVAPVVADRWSLAAWGMVAVGGLPGLVAGTATTGVATGMLARRLRGRVDRPVPEAARLAMGGTAHVGEWVARAVWRAWLPLLGAAALRSRRARRVLIASALVPAVADWIRERPALDPIRWTVLASLDQASYCAGVWAGAVEHRSARCLLPRLSGIPGATDPKTRDGDAPAPVDAD